MDRASHQHAQRRRERRSSEITLRGRLVEASATAVLTVAQVAITVGRVGHVDEVFISGCRSVEIARAHLTARSVFAG